MPDIGAPVYSRSNSFNDIGYSNLDVVGMPLPQIPVIHSDPNPVPQSPFDVLDHITQNLDTTTKKENPYLNSTVSQPYKTPVKDSIRYDDPTYGYSPFDPNIEYEYGDRQGVLDKWKNNIIKFGVNTVGSFVESLATIPLLIDAASNGDLSKVYNNPIADTTSSLMANIEQTLPNYETTYGKNHPILNWIPFIGNSGDSWGGLLKNLGFTAGAFLGAAVQDTAIGLLTGGAGDAILLPEQIMQGVSKIGKFFGTADEAATTLAQGLQRGEKIVDVIDKASSFNKGLNRFRYGTALLTSAISEGTFEANGLYNSVKNNLNQQFYDTYHRNPTDSERSEFEQWATSAGNVNLLANTALLTATNSISFGSLFKPTNVAKKALETEVAEGAAIKLEEGSIDAFKQAEKVKGKFSLIKDFSTGTGRLLKTNLSEAFEEGSQFFFQRTGEEYYKRKFNDRAIGETDNFMKSMGTALSDTLTTREGLENVILGFLTGAVIHVGRGALERRGGINSNRNQLINSTLGLLNSEKVTGLFENTYNESVVARSLHNQMQDDLIGNDRHEYENHKQQQLFNFVSSGVKASRFDLRIDQLNLMKDLPQAEFEKLFGTDTSENRQSVSAQVDKYIAKAQDIKSNIDKVENAFGKNPYNHKTDYDNYRAFNDYKDLLALDLSEIKDNRSRLSTLRSNLQTLAPNVDPEAIVKLTSERGVKETVTQFEKRIKEIEDFQKLSDDKSSDDYRAQTKEKSWLQEKIGNLNAHLENPVNDHKSFNYQHEALDILNYYSNGNKLGQTKISPIDIDEILEKGTDTYRLLSNTDRVLYHYQELSKKTGYTKYIAEAKAEYAAQQKKFSGQVDAQLNHTEAPIEKDEDTEELDEKGNPIPKDTFKPDDEKHILNFLSGLQNSQGINGWPGAREYIDKNIGKDADLKQIKDFVEKRTKELNNGPIMSTDNTGPVESEFDKEPLKKAVTPNQSIDSIIDEAFSKSKQASVDKQKADIEKRREKELHEERNATDIPLNIRANEERIGAINTKYDKELTALNTAQPKQDNLFSTQADEKLKAEQRAEGNPQEVGFKIMHPFTLFNRTYSPGRQEREGQKESREGFYDNDFHAALFGNTPSELLGKLSLNIQEAVPKEGGTRFGKWEPFKWKDSKEKARVIKGIFYQGYKNDIQFIVDGKIVSFMQPVERLAFDRNGEKLRLSEMTREEYTSIINENDPRSYDGFISRIKNYAKLTDYIQAEFSKGKTTFSNEELYSLIDFDPNYGGIDYKTSASSSTKISDLKYQGKGSVFLSLPMEYNEEAGAYLRSTVPTILNSKELSEEERMDAEEFIADNIDKILEQNGRYIYLVKLPDGTFGLNSILRARPAEASQETLNATFNKLKNLKEGMSAAEVKKINAELRDSLYIADSRHSRENKNIFSIQTNQNGDILFQVNNKTIEKPDGKKGYNIRIKIPGAKAAENFSDLVKIINEKVHQAASRDEILERLDITLLPKDFKAGIVQDDNVDQKTLSESLTVPTNPNIFENFSFTILPETQTQAEVKPVEQAAQTTQTETKTEEIAPTSSLSKEDQDFLKELLDNKVLPDTYRSQIESNPEGFLRFIAAQSNNKTEANEPLEGNATQATIDQFSQGVVDLANETFPEYSNKGKTKDDIEKERQAELNKNATTADLSKPEEVKKLIERKVEINAKYDAKLAVLEPTVVTPEQIQEVESGLETFIGEQPEEVQNYEVGEKVLFEGKEQTVTDKHDTGKGRVYYTINDGTRYGDKTVTPNQLQKNFVMPNIPDELEGVETRNFRDIYEPIGKSEAELVEDERVKKENYDLVGLKTILERLSNKFGLPYRVVKSDENFKGRWNKGVVEINLNKFDQTTPFHEYLHPFIDVLKLDNPELYNNLLTEFDNLNHDNDELADQVIREVKEDAHYQQESPEIQRDEMLVRYISNLASKNVNQEGRRIKGQYQLAMARMMDKFVAWMNKLWSAIGLKKAELKSLDLNMNLQDVADLVSLHEVQFDFDNYLNTINGFERLQTAAPKTDYSKKIVQIQARLNILEDTLKKRPSSVLQSQVRDLRAILKDPDTFESVANYADQAVKGLDYANDEFDRISAKIAASKGTLTQQQTFKLAQDLRIVKEFMDFYLNDAKFLLSKTYDKGDLKEELKARRIKDRAEQVYESIQGKQLDVLTEWMWPLYERQTKTLSERDPNNKLLIKTKEDFRNQFFQADSDISFSDFWLGSNASSKNPLNGIASVAIKEIARDNYHYSDEMLHGMMTSYDTFLKKNGLGRATKESVEHFKQNYLRKASVREIVQERDENGTLIKDDQGEPFYEYNSRWAFHEEFFHDIWAKKQREEVGETPEVQDEKAHKAWQDKTKKWILANTQVRAKADGNLETVPSQTYANPKWEQLKNDPFYQKLYSTYKEGNGKLHDSEQLQYGVVPQVSKHKGFGSGRLQGGVVDTVKEVGKRALNRVLPKAEEKTYSSTQTNLDGSTSRSIKVPFIITVEENDLDLSLPETVGRFAQSSDLVQRKREAEPIILALQHQIDVNSSAPDKIRKITKTTSKLQTVFNHVTGRPAAKEVSVGRLNEQLNQFINDRIYGEEEFKETAYLFGRPVDLNKLGGAITFVTAAGNMVGNVIASISNLTMGNYMNFLEAAGGRDYNRTNLIKANIQYAKHLPDMMRDASNLQKSKITQLLIRQNAIQGDFRDSWGKKFVGNLAQKYGTLDTLFILNHAAEHQIQTTAMLSLMDAQKVKLQDGSTISLFDAYEENKDGYIRIRKDALWTKENQYNFEQKLQAKNKAINGNYSKEDKAALQRLWYGKLLLVYRKYLYNGFKYRFGRSQIDLEYGDSTEGFYRTFMKKFADDLKTYKMEGIKRAFTKKGWSQGEKYAWNKTMFEVSTLAALTLGILALGGAGDDDKNKHKNGLMGNLLLLEAMRLRNDINTFNFLGAPNMVQIAKNPSAVMGTADRFYKFFYQLASDPTGTYKKETGGFDRGESILKAKFLKILPYRHLLNITNNNALNEQIGFNSLIGKK